MVKDFFVGYPPPPQKKKKLTWQWTITIFNRKYIFKWWIFHDFALSYVSFPECSLKRNMINSHIKGQVNFGSSQSMPNESKYTHFSATRIPTQRKNKMVWKTCPTPFQNWLVRLNFIGDASLVIPFISGTIIRSWWNMVKSYQIVSIFFLFGTLLVASRDFFFRHQTSDALERDKDPCLSQNELGCWGQIWDSICSVWISPRQIQDRYPQKMPAFF